MIHVFTVAGFRSPRSFKDPLRFTPERWLPKGHPYHDESFAQDKVGTVKPFGYGPQNCIGQNLAYAELRLILARLLYDLDFRILDNYRSWQEDFKIFQVWDKGPLFAEVPVR